MPNVINLERAFAKFSGTWSPKIIADLNGQQVKLARLEGDKCPWHAHELEDELFLVLQGCIEIHLRDGVAVVQAGECFVVPRQTEHRVVPREASKVLLFEPASTAHTGKTRSAITVDQCERLDA